MLITEALLKKNPARFVRNLSRTGGDIALWTPVLEATTTDPTMGDSVVYGDYTITMKKCFANLFIVIGSSFSAGTGSWFFAPPVDALLPAADSIFPTVGGGYLFDTSGTDLYTAHCQLIPRNGTNAGMIELLTPSTTSYQVGPTNPFTWATGDSISLELAFNVK